MTKGEVMTNGSTVCAVLIIVLFCTLVAFALGEGYGYKRGQADYARGIIKFHIVTNTVESVELKEKE